MSFRSIAHSATASAVPARQRDRPATDRMPPPVYSRAATATPRPIHVDGRNTVPIVLLDRQIKEILSATEKRLRPGEPMRIRIDGVDKVLGRTSAGDRVYLQTEQEFGQRSSNGIFLGQENRIATMMIDNRYLSTPADPPLGEALRVVSRLQATLR